MLYKTFICDLYIWTVSALSMQLLRRVFIEKCSIIYTIYTNLFMDFYGLSVTLYGSWKYLCSLFLNMWDFVLPYYRNCLIELDPFRGNPPPRRLAGWGGTRGKAKPSVTSQLKVPHHQTTDFLGSITKLMESLQDYHHSPININGILHWIYASLWTVQCYVSTFTDVYFISCK